MIEILQFINALKRTDNYIELIYLNGSCYKFHLLLKKLYPESEAFINKDKDHVITKYLGKFYDITGEVSGNWYTPMTTEEKDIASNWSFCKSKALQITECPYCEEPILI